MTSRSVSLIRNEDGGEPIDVRLIRKWQSFVFKDECCYLFVDKEGHAIEACGNTRDQMQFDKKMELQGCYRVSNYLSQKARKSHKVVPQDATVKLVRGTSFTPIEPSGFPLHYFNFAPFHIIRSRMNVNLQLTDYIGRFDSITVDRITSSGRKLFKFILEDAYLNEKFIEVALWGDIVDMVDKEGLTDTPFPCIVAVTSMKVTEHQQLQLESSAPTHIYINPQVPETDDLIERFTIRYTNIPQNQRGRFTIAQLLQIDPAQNFERRFSCIARITNLIHGKKWFYRGCVQCNKKLNKRGAGWMCGNHPNEQQQRYMYCLNVTIEDETEMATVTLFDEAVFSLVRIDAMKMVIEKAFEDPETIPDSLQVLIGQTKMFQLQFNNRIDQGSTRFTCNKVLENPNVPQQVPQQKPPSTELQQSLLQENISKDKTIIADQTHTVAPPYSKSISPATNTSTPPPNTPAPTTAPKRHANVDTSDVAGPIPAKRQLQFGDQCKLVESPKKDNHPRNLA